MVCWKLISVSNPNWTLIWHLRKVTWALGKVWQPGGKSDSPEEYIFPRFPWLQKPFTCYTFFKKNQIALKTFFLRVARTIIPAKYFFSNRTEFQTEKVWFVWRNFFLKNWFFFFLLKLMLKLCLYLQISQICAKKLKN